MLTLLIVSPTGQGFLNHEGVKSCRSAGKNTKTGKIVFLRGLVRVCLNFVVFAVPCGEKAPRLHEAGLVDDALLAEPLSRTKT